MKKTQLLLQRHILMMFADDSDDEAAGHDAFVDLMKGLNMTVILMLTKTLMMQRMSFLTFLRVTPERPRDESDGLKAVTVHVNQA